MGVGRKAKLAISIFFPAEVLPATSQICPEKLNFYFFFPRTGHPSGDWN